MLGTRATDIRNGGLARPRPKRTLPHTLIGRLSRSEEPIWPMVVPTEQRVEEQLNCPHVSTTNLASLDSSADCRNFFMPGTNQPILETGVSRGPAGWTHSPRLLSAVVHDRMRLIHLILRRNMIARAGFAVRSSSATSLKKSDSPPRHQDAKRVETDSPQRHRGSQRSDTKNSRVLPLCRFPL